MKGYGKPERCTYEGMIKGITRGNYEVVALRLKIRFISPRERGER